MKIINKLFFPICISFGFALCLSSCATTGAKLKADVIGFSEDAITSYNLTKSPIKLLQKQELPYNLLRKEERGYMENFVWGLPEGQNTAAIYSLDLALDRVKYVRRKKDIMGWDPDSKYIIITLTDGLDNVSKSVAKKNYKGNYNTIEEYEQKIQKKMQKATTNFFGNRQCSLTSFCLVYKGDDLKERQKMNGMNDEQFETHIKEKFNNFTGSSKGTPRPEVIYGDNFAEMFEDFANQFKSASFNFYIPKDYVGKKIRMNLTDKNGNKATIEGNFTKGSWGKYQLTNLTLSEGLSCEQEKEGSIISINNEANTIASTFAIKNLKYQGKPFRVIDSKQDYCDNDGMWGNNSEYNQKSSLAKNAYIIVLLDGSKSFHSQSENAKDMIFKIIDVISE